MFEMKCSCSQGYHRAPLEKIVFEEGAINRIPEILKDYKRIFVLSDATTYEVAGKRVIELLKESNQYFHSYELKKDPLPTPESLGEIMVHIYPPLANTDMCDFSPLPDFILGVGSGVVNDLSRLSAFRLQLPYGICGTAPSMDGYASGGSPFLFDNTKATIKCNTPRYIIGDLDILAEAPFDMLQAGIGDMLGKYTAILDWELARDYKNDYYCTQIADDVIEATNKCLENSRQLKSRSHEIVKNIMDGFIVSGLGMAYTGCSRPASGAEHMFSHIWELNLLSKGKKPNLHGLEVMEATRIVMFMYKKLYNETDDAHLKELIEKYFKYFEETEKAVEFLEMPTPVADYDMIIEGVLKGLKLRDRYTIMHYLDERGLLESYADEAAKWLLKSLEK